MWSNIYLISAPPNFYILSCNQFYDHPIELFSQYHLKPNHSTSNLHTTTIPYIKPAHPPPLPHPRDMHMNEVDFMSSATQVYQLCYVFIWKSILISPTLCRGPIHPCRGLILPLSRTGTLSEGLVLYRHSRIMNTALLCIQLIR